MQLHNQPITREYLDGLMADLIKTQKEAAESSKESSKEVDRQFLEIKKMFQETDRKFQETDRKFQDTDRKFQEIHKELGGIGKSNGAIAEDFFAAALEKSMQVGKLKFDFIDFNQRRKRNNTEAEYDIILYNSYKVLIVEVKYIFRLEQLRPFYEKRLKRFRTLFPEHKEYKLYGAIAAFSFEDEVIEEALKYGFYILSPDNENIKIVNQSNFEVGEIK